MSFDETILLKIKREFTTNEAVQQVLKLLSDSEVEVGVLKSEISELNDRLKDGKTKKQWLQDELINDMSNQLQIQKKKTEQYKKSMDEWRNKYFSLFASINVEK